MNFFRRTFCLNWSMTDTSLRSFSVFVSVAVKILICKTELNNYEAISIKYCDCVSVFLPLLCGEEIASFLGWFILFWVACLTPTYFYTICNVRQDIRGKTLIRLHTISPLLSNFNKIWIFSADFAKILKYSISWKSVQRDLIIWWGRVDGQTWRCQQSLFAYFANALQNAIINVVISVLLSAKNTIKNS